MNRKRSWSSAEKRMVVAVTLAAALLALAPNLPRLYRNAAGLPQEIQVPTGVTCAGIAWSYDGKSLAGLLNEHDRPTTALAGSLAVWDAGSFELKRSVPLPIKIATYPPSPRTARIPFMGAMVMWLHDGSLVAGGHTREPQLIVPGASKSQPLLASTPLDFRWQPTLYFSADERSGISVGSYLYVLNRVPQGWSARQLDCRPRGEYLAAILPQGDRCVLVAEDPLRGPANPRAFYPPRSLELMDLRTGKVLWSNPEKEVTSLVLGPSGESVYVTMGDITHNEGGSIQTHASWVMAYRVRDGKELWRTAKVKTGRLDSLAISPDGKLLAARRFTPSGAPQVWMLKAKDGSDVTVLNSVSPLVASRRAASYGFMGGRQIDFSSDGSRLALASLDKIYLWDSSLWGGR
jgi:WD40 repeat protein